MKTITYFLIVIAWMVLTSAGHRSAEKPKPFAIVELFTAEGCSSCPAADELLEEMSGILEKEGKAVMPLSFHVTYWNKGWEDPYSQEIFTERQKKYVDRLKFEQLYTPQAIVNGENEFIGSNPIAFRDLVTQAVSKNPTYAIDAKVSFENSKVYINYELNKEPKSELINIALVEESVVHFVARGENQGRTLKHHNVVRKFETSEAKKTDQLIVDLPRGVDPKKCAAIIYLQSPKTLHVLGAVRKTLQDLKE